MRTFTLLVEASTSPLARHGVPLWTPFVALQDGIYGNDIRQLLSLTEVMPGNISAGLVGDIVAIVNPGAAYTIGFSIGGSAQGRSTVSAGISTVRLQIPAAGNKDAAAKDVPAQALMTWPTSLLPH